MNIFSKMFGSDATHQQPTQQVAPVVPVAPGQPATPGNIPPQQVVAEPGNPTAPVQEVAPVAPVVKKDESPLAEFSTLWDTKPIEEGKGAPQEPPALTAEAVQKVVAKTDFSKLITPETLEAIAAGGDGAAAATLSAMNQVAQQVMVQTTMVGNKLTEQAVNSALEKQQAQLPELLRSQAASDHLKTANPLFSNPAVKPVIEATQAQLLQKFPNATHAEITKMTQDYIVAMGAEFAPKATVNDNSTSGETDWDVFMSAD